MCSTVIFNVGDRKCLAENYDYLLDHGLVGTNLRGTKKTNGQSSSDQRIEWTVTYGSVTFNQFSLEMPVSGMNEAGLAVALMWHEEGDFGDSGKFVRLNSLQWIQYQLDNYQAIDEVIDGLQKIRPERGPIPLHFTLLDSHGDSLIVEFVGGELALKKNSDYPILTNTSFEKCITATVGSHRDEQKRLGNSIGRFAHLHELLSRYDCENSALGGFRLLDSVSQTPRMENDESFPWDVYENGTITAWSIVFDPSRRTILLKTNQNNEIRELNLKELQLDASGEYLIADINSGAAGSMTRHLEPYSKDKNQAILTLSASTIGLPDTAIDGLAEIVDDLYRKRRMN